MEGEVQNRFIISRSYFYFIFVLKTHLLGDLSPK